ncbi:MAG: hypothetical protein DMD73_00500 [Gemmatimonadetes bacterium]|nr:MAG: hypothetical protein DMD73_00500 [Gemmatimonadota bacterium]
MARTAGSGIARAAGTISPVQRVTDHASERIHGSPTAASADSYPETDSLRLQASLRSRRTHLGIAP